MRRRRIMSRSFVLLTFFAALVGTCSTVQAAVALSDAVMLSDLIANGDSIIAGDKLFDQFSYSATGDMPSSANVQLIPIEQSGNYGIRLYGGFLDYNGDGASIATLSYRVTALDAGMGINGAQLSGNPAVLPTGTGFFTIEESFASLDMPTQLVIFDQVPGGVKLADSVGLNSVYPTLTVEVKLTGDSTAEEVGAVTASFVDQTFSQGVVPEPQSLLIWMGSALLFGAVTLIHRRWVPHRCRR